MFLDYVSMHVGDIQESAAVLWPPQWHTTYQALPAWQAISTPQYILSEIQYSIFVKPLATPAPIHVRSHPLKPAETASWVAGCDQYSQACVATQVLCRCVYGSKMRWGS